MSGKKRCLKFEFLLKNCFYEDQMDYFLALFYNLAAAAEE